MQTTISTDSRYINMNCLIKVFVSAVAVLSGFGITSLAQHPDPASADSSAIHFWDNIRSASADSLHERMSEFISMLPRLRSDSIRSEAVRRAVESNGNTEESAYRFSQTAEDCLFARTSPLRDEPTYITFLRAMLAAGYPDSIRSEWMLAMVGKNQPGSVVADFTFTDRAGKSHTLYHELGKPVILLFYDPECDDCHNTARELAADSVVNAALENGAVRVLAINPASADGWRELPQDFPPTWLDGNDDGVLEASGTFFFSSYPSIYFLDAKGKVVLKDPSVSDIAGILREM